MELVIVQQVEICIKAVAIRRPRVSATNLAEALCISRPHDGKQLTVGQIDTGAKAAELEAMAGRIIRNNNASTRSKSTDARPRRRSA